MSDLRPSDGHQVHFAVMACISKLLKDMIAQKGR